MINWDELDRRLLDMLQTDFPLSVQPFQDLAERLGLEEGEVLQRIAAMKQAGVIRRLGGIMDARGLGFYSTLCAIKVPEAQIETVADTVNQLPGVTHNYLRDHDLNMWFTLTVPSQADALATIKELEKRVGLDIISMPARKVYKIKVAFSMENEDD